MLKRAIALVFLVLSVSGIGQLWHFLKDGFSINRIFFSLEKPSESKTFCEEPSPHWVEPLLERSYRYLGRGRQCYAFESLDGRVVLKLPRFDRYALPVRWRAVPFSLFERSRRLIWEDRQERLAFTLQSFRIAARELKEQTGVLYLHLQKTEGLPKRLVLLDRLNRRFSIDPNQTVFILQEKKELMMPAFISALHAQDRAKAERILQSFLQIIEERAKLGIFNKDPSFLKNFGWGDERGVQIDIGSFYRKTGLNPLDAYRRSLFESTGPLREWLAAKDQDLLEQFNQRLEECLRKELPSSSL